MSRFFSSRYSNLTPYTPGEQPDRMQEYIKLNTNESPYPPHEDVVKAAAEAAAGLQIYSKPEWSELTEKLAEINGVEPDQIILTNGSDEVLNFAFMAFADENAPLVFPDITYGFYPVFAELNHIPYDEIPVGDDFAVDPGDYLGIGRTIVIANPNSPTGTYMSLDKIEDIVQLNPDNVVIIDEAYVDFGAESAVKLVDRYDNLLVTQTFSKSRSLAGGRLGFGTGSRELIADLNTIKYSTNPYNVNSMTAAAGLASVMNNDYYMSNCGSIMETRQWTRSHLEELGFEVTDSKANFLFVKSDRIDGEKLYLELKEKGILIRHFTKDRIAQYNRVSIGTMSQMEAFIRAVETILEVHK